MYLLSRVKRYLHLKGKFQRSVLILMGGAITAQALSVVISPLLTRLYTPSDFGIFGVYIAIVGLLTTIASLRYEYGLPITDSLEEALKLLILCFSILTGSVLLSGLVFWVLGSKIVHLIKTPELTSYLLLIPIGLFSTSTYQIFNYWLIRERKFAQISRIKIYRSGTRVTAQIIGGILNTSPIGLILGQIAGDISALVFFFSDLWDKKPLVRNIKIKGIAKIAFRYRRFPLFSSWAGLLESASIQLPQIILAALYGASPAGWFLLTRRIIGVPLSMVVDSISQAYFGESSALFRANPTLLLHFFLRISGYLVIFGALPLTIVGVLFPRGIFSVVFGAEWEIAGRYAQVMIIMFAARLVAVPFSHTFSVLERQDIYSFWQTIRVVLALGSLIVCKFLSFSHIQAVMGYSFAMSLGYILLWLFSLYAIKNTVTK